MKKIVVFLAFMFVLCAVAMVMAAPFIVADPSTATKYRMRLSADNGATWSAWVEGNPVAGAMKFDIVATPAGSYKGEAQAGGNVTVTDSTTGNVSTVWMWSASAPFLLNKLPGQVAVNIRVTE